MGVIAPQRILSFVKESLLKREVNRRDSSNFYIQEDIFTVGQPVPIPLRNVRVNRPTIMTFADDAPLFNWAHPCRYLFHNADTGELYQEITAQFPPYARETETPKTFRAFHTPVKVATTTFQTLKPTLLRKPRAIGSRYAVLFSGMSNNRHLNDLEFLYRTLMDVYNVPQANIYVLNHDGTANYDAGPKPVKAWPGDSTAYRLPIRGKGSKADLLGVFDELKKRLQSSDTLLIHTNNHGGHDGKVSNLCCYPNWDKLTVTEFTNKLAELPRFRSLIVMMEQCHSGGFNQAIINKSPAGMTSVASACEELNSSKGGDHFDPFAHDWITAMAGFDAYGYALKHNPNINGDHRVSSKEAFDYANSIHVPYDTPVFSQVNDGGSAWLGQDFFSSTLRSPLLIEKLIKKYWPEPDPLIVQKRIEAILPEIDAIEKEFEPQHQGVQQAYEKRLMEVVQKAAKL